MRELTDNSNYCLGKNKELINFLDLPTTYGTKIICRTGSRIALIISIRFIAEIVRGTKGRVPVIVSPRFIPEIVC